LTISRRRDEEIECIVSAVADRFPWYRSQLSASTFASTRRLEDLPYLSDDVLLAHYYASTDPLGPNEVPYHTSGTVSGTRKRVLWSQGDHGAYVAQRAAILGPFLSGCRSACADLGTGHAAASAREVFDLLGLKSESIDFTLPIARHIEILNRSQPEVLFTMPMILDRLLATEELFAPIRKIILLGDVAPQRWLQEVARRLQIETSDITDLYGSIEVGSIAYLDHADRRYRFGPNIIPEVIDAPDGQILVVTSLARVSFPAIRYVTGDLVEGFKADGDGFSFEAVTGRVSDDLKHGEKLSRLSILEATSAVLSSIDVEIFRDGHRMMIEVASPDFSRDAARRIVELIRGANPAVDQMIRSGLIGDIEVVGMPVVADPSRPKRGIHDIGR
jgi:phenylacetate-coenzyme A ligase PaaK-like adenylate-forming protein